MLIISLLPFNPVFPNFVVLLYMQNEEYCAKLQKSNERTLALVKAGMDIVLAVGLLQSAPKKVTPRVTGAFGFVSSLISCYQVLDSRLSILYLISPFLFTGLLDVSGECIYGESLVLSRKS